MTRTLLENIVIPGKPCPFTREEGSHPLIEKFGIVYICRHCGIEVSVQENKDV